MKEGGFEIRILESLQIVTKVSVVCRLFLMRTNFIREKKMTRKKPKKVNMGKNRFC